MGQKLGDYLMNSPKAQSGMQEVSDDAKGLANLLTLGVGGKAATKLAGDSIYDASKASYVQDLVKPKATPTQAAENALNTTQINGKNIYEPPAYEQKMAQAVSSIPEVSPLNSYQKNLDLVQNAHIKEAEDLKANVDANNAPINASDIVNKFDQVQQELNASPA